jgi:aminopeptidase N
MWSQGQDIDSRWWFPCLDYPIQKASVELRATVEEPYFCLGNGSLISEEKNKDGTNTYHWKQTHPHVNYLTTLVVGEFVAIHDHWNQIPLTYYVPPALQERAHRTFEKTPDILTCFSEKTGVSYPYEKYAQIVVQNFIFGGMENTTATTLSERILVDERAAVDYDTQYLSLIAHEIAHQWWGNLVSCRGFNHAWLNEGFATFFEIVYFEHLKGQEEADYYSHEDLKTGYLNELKNYKRCLVETKYF